MGAIIIVVHPFFTDYYEESYKDIYEIPKKRADRIIKDYQQTLFKTLKDIEFPIILFEEPSAVEESKNRLKKENVNVSEIRKTESSSGLLNGDQKLNKFTSEMKLKNIQKIYICGSYYAKKRNLTEKQLDKIDNKDEHLHCVGHVVEALKENFEVEVIEKCTLDFSRKTV